VLTFKAHCAVQLTAFYALIVWCAAAAASPAGPPPAFRLEAHPLPTITLTTKQFLSGTVEGGAPATIAGQLTLPPDASTRLPAVLMLHGDAGQLSNQVQWIELLNSMGVAVFTLDSFSGRGAVSSSRSLSSMPRSVSGSARVIDAYRALSLLSAHPRIDPQRIAVLGWSSGGHTVLLAAQSRFAKAFRVPATSFAAYVALYPDCNVRMIGETQSEPAPQRIYIGTADVMTSAKACSGYVDRLRAAGADIEIATYADAHHGFDMVGTGALNRVPDVLTTAECLLHETPDGQFVNDETGRPLVRGDACVGKGLVAGYDAAADEAVKLSVTALLKKRFALP